MPDTPADDANKLRRASLVIRHAHNPSEGERTAAALRFFGILATVKNIHELSIVRNPSDSTDFEATVKAWLAGQSADRHTTRDILYGALGIPMDIDDHDAFLRLADVMREIGWIECLAYDATGKRVKGWKKPGPWHRR